MKKRRLLIAGGGYADIPLILAAKKLGYHVITSGNRPDELGHRHSDHYEPADFSDAEAMLALAQHLKIDAIVPCCNDFSALSSAYVAHRLDLPGHDACETSMIIHHKDSYRDFALAHGIPAPKAKAIECVVQAMHEAASLRLPIIVKPVDLTGGKGMTKVRSAEEVPPAVEKALQASRAKRVVIEEFLSGSRHGFSTFIRDGRVVFYFSDNEHYFLNPFLVSAASAPGDVSPSVEKTLCGWIEKIASRLSLVTGIVHVQYMLRGDGPVIIEICRRAPGDLYVRWVELATGVPYAEWILRAFAGLDCSDVTMVGPKGFTTRHCVMSAKPGRVKDVVFDASIKKNVIDRLMWWKPGDPVTDVLTSKFGIVFLRFDSREEMLDKTERMQQLIRVETE